MKKVAFGCLLLILLAVGGALAFVSTLPNDYALERSTKIEAPPERVYALVADLKDWPNWSAWTTERDSTAEWTYSGADSGVGAATEWIGAAQDEGGLGHGKMIITAATPSSHLAYDLTFIEEDGTEMSTTGEVNLVADGDGTKVTWSMAGSMEGFQGKMFALAMDALVGPEFDLGLRGLRDLAEVEIVETPVSGD